MTYHCKVDQQIYSSTWKLHTVMNSITMDTVHAKHVYLTLIKSVYPSSHLLYYPKGNYCMLVIKALKTKNFIYYFPHLKVFLVRGASTWWFPFWCLESYGRHAGPSYSLLDNLCSNKSMQLRFWLQSNFQSS